LTGVPSGKPHCTICCDARERKLPRLSRWGQPDLCWWTCSLVSCAGESPGRRPNSSCLSKWCCWDARGFSIGLRAEPARRTLRRWWNSSSEGSQSDYSLSQSARHADCSSAAEEGSTLSGCCCFHQTPRVAAGPLSNSPTPSSVPLSLCPSTRLPVISPRTLCPSRRLPVVSLGPSALPVPNALWLASPFLG